MTIKQQGGIFGRNPTFNDVEVKDLTATDVVASTGSFSTSLASGGVTASSYASTARDFVTGTTSGQGGITLVGDPTTQTNIFFADGTSGGAVAAGYIIYQHSQNQMLIGTNNGTAFTATSSGNLAFPSGQGIDFSATSDGSGTSSSELFDDYEEGTWTPTYIPASGAFDAISYNVQEGYYTKIGNMVHLRLTMRITSLTKGTASGNVYVTGLPYTAANSRSTGAVLSSNFLDDHPSICQPYVNNLFLYYKDAADGSGTNVLNVTDLDTGSTDNAITIFVCYQAS